MVSKVWPDIMEWLNNNLDLEIDLDLAALLLGLVPADWG